MPEVRVGALSFHVTTQGAGDPLLLICGTGMDSTAWMLHAPAFAQHRTVITFDNRDSGLSSAVAHDYTPADMAADTAGVLRGLGVERADVLGYSLGGAIAQELALAEPALVRRLVLQSTWAGPDAWLQLRFATWEQAAATFERERIVDAGALDLFTHRWFADPGNLEFYRQVALSNPNPQPRDGLVRQWRADQAHDARDRLASLTHPALVIAGAEDVLVPARYSRELAGLIPGASYTEIDAAGHGAHIERPEAYLDAVTGFFVRPI